MNLRQTGVPIYKTYSAADFAQFDTYYNAGAGVGSCPVSSPQYLIACCGGQPAGDMVGPVSKPGIQKLNLKSQVWPAANVTFRLDMPKYAAQGDVTCV